CGDDRRVQVPDGLRVVEAAALHGLVGAQHAGPGPLLVELAPGDGHAAGHDVEHQVLFSLVDLGQPVVVSVSASAAAGAFFPSPPALFMSPKTRRPASMMRWSISSATSAGRVSSLGSMTAPAARRTMTPASYADVYTSALPVAASASGAALNSALRISRRTRRGRSSYGMRSNVRSTRFPWASRCLMVTVGAPRRTPAASPGAAFLALVLLLIR